MFLRPRILATLAAFAVLAASGAARAHATDVLPLPDFARRLTLLPTGQLDDASLELIPKGSLSHEPWELPIVTGQFFAGAVLNVGAAIMFTRLAEMPAGTSTDAVRKSLLKWGLLQLAATPLVSNTGIWLVGGLSEFHDVMFGWPLLVNYVMELGLVALKVGLGFGLGDAKGGEAVDALSQLLGPFLVVDYILHGVLVPLTVTYFSIRSRGPKGMSFETKLERPSPELVAEVRRTFASAADRRDEDARDAAGPLAITLPVAAMSF